MRKWNEKHGGLFSCLYNQRPLLWPSFHLYDTARAKKRLKWNMHPGKSWNSIGCLEQILNENWVFFQVLISWLDCQRPRPYFWKKARKGRLIYSECTKDFRQKFDFFLLLIHININVKCQKCRFLGKPLLTASNARRSLKKPCCSQQKCAQGTKYVALSENEVHNDTMGAKCNLLWHIMVLNCRVWPYMASCRVVL